MVVNKPPNMLSVPDRYDPNIPNLYQRLSRQFGKVYPVHRLDRDTSGLIVFALSRPFFKHLSDQFTTRNIQKHYEALVIGVPEPPQGSIRLPIIPLSNQNKVGIGSRGKLSVTHYKIRTSYDSFAHLDLDLETGRTHQIRVHLQAIGNPLLVDLKYGGKEGFFLSEIKKNYRGNRDEERPLLSRTPLHACALRFPDLEGQERAFSAPIPKDMKAVINQLAKWKDHRSQQPFY